MIPPPAAPAGVGLLAPVARPAAARPGADRYRKHFSAAAHWDAALACVTGPQPASDPRPAGGGGRWFAGVGLPARGQSQPVRPLLHQPRSRLRRTAVRRTRGHGPGTTPPTRWPRTTRGQLVDSSFLAPSAKLSPWSQHGGHLAGVRLQARPDLADTIPGAFAVTLAHTHDTTGLGARDLADLRGWTVVFDLGYYGHPRFAGCGGPASRSSVRCSPRPDQMVADRPRYRRSPPPTATPCSPTRPSSSAPPPTAPPPGAGAAPGHQSQPPRPEPPLRHRPFGLAAVECSPSTETLANRVFFRWLKHQLGCSGPAATPGQRSG